MSNEQSPLFADRDAAPATSSETLADINHELTERALLHPEIRDRRIFFGEGRAGMRLALVGESPAPPDIESGHLFTGPSGDLLDRILHAINLTRQDIYVTNAVKMISTGEEITASVLSFFTPYLHRELAAVRPHIIVASGNTPTRALTGTKKGITQMRGEWHDYRGMKLMPTFNPAYLLRDPSKKRETWEDMKKVRDLLATFKD